jgi:hypothetical protein
MNEADGVKRKFHICQSVTGPLRAWTKKDWKKATGYITRNDGTKYSPDELKECFLEELSRGHKVIPIGVCDNFDYEHGCMGHVMQEVSC